MRAKGLEPPRLSALDPKSSAATNYAMPASEQQHKDTAFPYICKAFENIISKKLLPLRWKRNVRPVTPMLHNCKRTLNS